MGQPALNASLDRAGGRDRRRSYRPAHSPSSRSSLSISSVTASTVSRQPALNLIRFAAERLQWPLHSTKLVSMRATYFCLLQLCGQPSPSLALLCVGLATRSSLTDPPLIIPYMTFIGGDGYISKCGAHFVINKLQLITTHTRFHLDQTAAVRAN